ncbi:MAG: cytochrome c3 family protein [Desulfobacterales bacterium]|nr:MAG: cytochrome c3 family protein [Desulfobacterales bacterium]UCD91017.1 MAG: cytochrome c3 family protein [Desulfobacterales bacterium]
MRSSEAKLMKYGCALMVLFLAVIITASMAWSQEDVQQGIMDLKSLGFKKHFQPPVRFDHYLHETLIRCRVCHHDFNIFSNRNFGKGSKCSSCHKEKLNKDIPVPLLMAFHKMCRGCHENYLNWGRRSGPVMCGVCHK